ncbi:MAG: gamma-glutamyl-gamma-aminobutyrate hydrolase family protein [Myxococcota bacterium]|nr:gamma-glutamyl-gamma-aminobutyrate hydrolase family protein [Myxococcota bacterium]
MCLDDRERWRVGREYLYLDDAYPRALTEAGAQPVLLPVGSDPREQVAGIDGLLLPGGDDFLPEESSSYADTVQFDPVSPRQLDFDRALLAAALEKEIPILGICYGAQLMALHHGGELHYDLPSDRPESGDHQLPEQGGRHPVDIDTRSRLGRILRRGEVEVNSLHHQAIARVGQGFKVSAQAPDGVIEAIESTGESFELGVQWHPEKMTDAAGRELFRALVLACEHG